MQQQITVRQTWRGRSSAQTGKGGSSCYTKTNYVKIGETKKEEHPELHAHLTLISHVRFVKLYFTKQQKKYNKLK
jgi:hypothetical protein